MDKWKCRNKKIGNIDILRCRHKKCKKEEEEKLKRVRKKKCKNVKM